MSKDREDQVIRIPPERSVDKKFASLLLEAERTPPTEVLDNVIAFPGAEYGCENMEEFLDGFVDRVLANSEKVHMMFAGGEPGNGKTSILYEAAAKITMPQHILEGKRVSVKTARAERTRLMKEADKRGYTVLFHNFPWGDASEYLYPEWTIDTQTDYHTDQIARDAKQREVNYAEKIMQEAILRKTRSCNEAAKDGEKVINIFIGDVPINTGDVIDGNQYGIIRAHKLMQEMMHHTGSFADIDYEASFFTLSASTDVREKAFGDRQIMADPTLDDEQRQKLLLEQGTDFNTTQEEVRALIKEVASPGQMDLIEQDVNEVLVPLHAQADPMERPGYSYEDTISFDSLRLRKDQLRVPLIGRIQLPHILHDILKVPPDKNVGNFFNFRVVERIDMYGWLVNSRPIADQRDEIMQEIKEHEGIGEQANREIGYYRKPPPPDLSLLGGELY